jgi:hypothetical protein
MASYKTGDVQRLPIHGATTYPYLAGMVGPINPGYDQPPYEPSPNLDPTAYKLVK